MPVAPKRPCADPTCGTLTNRGRCVAHRPQRNRERGSSTAQGYGANWRKLRLMVLREEPLCRVCTAEGRVVLATDVDHIIPRANGGTEDKENLQPLCHNHHSQKTSREDGWWGSHAPMTQMQPFAVPVTVVCGPPGSGKTTYATERLRWGHVIVDLDALFAALTGQDTFDQPTGLLPIVCEARDAVITRLARPSHVDHAWVIMGGAKRDDRERYTAAGANVVILAVDAVECIRRISQDPRRSQRWELWKPIVERWWREYEA